MISTEGDDGDGHRRDIFDTRANSTGTNAYSLKKKKTKKKKKTFTLTYLKYIEILTDDKR